jgi:hypothetical protein
MILSHEAQALAVGVEQVATPVIKQARVPIIRDMILLAEVAETALTVLTLGLGEAVAAQGEEEEMLTHSQMEVQGDRALPLLDGITRRVAAAGEEERQGLRATITPKADRPQTAAAQGRREENKVYSILETLPQQIKVGAEVVT